MNTKEMNEARAEVVNHLGEFIARLSYALRDFVTPLDPTEGPDEMAYIRRVIDAVDNVVLVATLRENDEQAIEVIKESADLMMENLIKFHTEGEVKH
ncbi:hypothetical protein RCIP0096_00023 [Klebsiella phage RCIP0096]